ncbi:MAG: hypothetical protein ACYC1L_09695 [Alphaproteobacteria bacterium]
MSPAAKPLPVNHKGIVASLFLVSNRPQNITALLDNIEVTVSDPHAVEVLIKVDEGDGASIDRMLREEHRRPFRVRALVNPPPADHFELWRSLNDLFKMVDPTAYFVSNINDEVRFLSKGWDAALRRHIGAFPDHLFRLRCSRFKLRNYFDVWECWYAPENFGFHTKRWVDVQGDWNACHVSDAFQQCVAFYLALGSYPGAFQTQRDIPISGIEMGGQEAAEGLTADQLERRNLGNDRAWYRIMSPEMQTEICRRARLIQAHIWLHEHGYREFELRDIPNRRRIEIYDRSGACLIVYSYRVDEEKIQRDLERERQKGDLFHFRQNLNFINDTTNFLGPADGEYVNRVFHTSRTSSQSTTDGVASSQTVTAPEKSTRLHGVRAMVGRILRGGSR